MDVIIKNILNYNLAVKDKVKQILEKKKQLPEDVGNFIFIGKHNHDTTQYKLLEFLEFLIINCKQISLGTNNIDTLWKVFV